MTSPFRAWLLASSVICLIAIGAPATAQEDPQPTPTARDNGDAEREPRVAVLDVRTTKGGSNDVTRKLRSALVSGVYKYRVQVVEDHPAVVAAHGQGAELRYELGLLKAKKYLAAGEAAYKKFDSKTAETRLRKAADLYEANAAGMRSPDALIDTYLLLARVFFATNRELLARDIFKRLVQLKPELTLDVANYPPAMIKSFKSVKAEVLSSPLGTLSVDSHPPGIVYLDGRKRGNTPLELINLPAGVHLLVVRRTGFAPHVQKVDVTSFRQEKVEADLVLDRHPQAHMITLPANHADLEKMNDGLVEYLDAVAKEARLDLIAFATAAPLQNGVELQARLYASKEHTITPVRSFEVGRSPNSLDDVADRLLNDAADEQLIPTLAARRNVRSGGGALDETKKYRGHIAFSPGVNVATGTAVNFPEFPGASIRVGAVRRMTGRIVLSAETGFDNVVQPRMKLTDIDGVVVADEVDGVTGIYTGVPLEVGARYYLGIRKFAPYVAAGGGARLDTLLFQEQLDFDEIRAPIGVGWNVFAALGGDWALKTDTGLFGELRLTYGQVGIQDAEREVINTPESPDGVLPIDAGDPIGIRLVFGYLKVF